MLRITLEAGDVDLPQSDLIEFRPVRRRVLRGIPLSLSEIPRRSRINLAGFISQRHTLHNHPVANLPRRLTTHDLGATTSRTAVLNASCLQPPPQ